MRYKLVLKESVLPTAKRKLILTSSGFDNKNFSLLTKKLLKKPMKEVKVLFIPTADRKKEMIRACISEILELGIPKSNIEFNDCSPNITNVPDMIYVAGGDENYLMDQIIDNGFKKILLTLINNGVLYVGVSAGSYICGKMVNRSNSLNLFKFIIEPHQNKHHCLAGPIDNNIDIVNISDDQAVLVLGNKIRVIE